jgi:hypothetical protein
VVVVKGKMEVLVILVVLVAVVLVVEIHREHQEVVQLKHHLVVERDMVLPVVMGKQDLHTEEAAEVELVLLAVQVHQLLEMDQVDMEYKHPPHLEIL